MKKAFTLVELLVTIAISTILVAAVGVTIFFVMSSDASITSSINTNQKIFIVKDYILNKEIVDDSHFEYDEETKLFSYDSKTLEFNDEVSVSFFEEDGFIKCIIKYYDNSNERTLKFTVKEA